MGLGFVLSRYVDWGWTSPMDREPMMDLRSSEQRLLSRPFPVEWAGWESTTYRLQCCGWKIATQFNYSDDLYRFAFLHEGMNLQGYADWVHIERALTQMCSGNLPAIRVTNVAQSLLVAQVDAPLERSVTPWHLIDGRPRLSCEPIRTMEDFSVFAKRESKEILIPQADLSVVEQLEAIIRAQEPKQHELRQLILAKPRGLRQIASIAEVA